MRAYESVVDVLFTTTFSSRTGSTTIDTRSGPFDHGPSFIDAPGIPREHFMQHGRNEGIKVRNGLDVSSAQRSYLCLQCIEPALLLDRRDRDLERGEFLQAERPVAVGAARRCGYDLLGALGSEKVIADKSSCHQSAYWNASKVAVRTDSVVVLELRHRKRPSHALMLLNTRSSS